IRDRLAAAGAGAAAAWLQGACGLDAEGARQLVDYVRAQLESVGLVPTCDALLVERFFDDAGGMQLVVHSPLGARINRGFGLALRKRFCRAFNQELQAAATDDALVLSLGNPQTFPLESVVRFLTSATIQDTLEQALLGSPLFQARWRWNATRALAVLRTRGKGRVPFAIQRMQADDLMAAAFPDQAACQENVQYPIDIPDHPLVRQTLHDALHEACDVEGLRELLERIEKGTVKVHTRDTVSASPFAHEILNAKPYAFLDDAPLEERRTRAVQLRHVLPESARDLARLEPEAIGRVREEALATPRDPDELYELLGDLGWARPGDLPGGRETDRVAEALIRAGRAARCPRPEALVAAERIPDFETVFPEAQLAPDVELPEALRAPGSEREGAVDRAVRGHLEVVGPTTSALLAERLGLEPAEVEGSLARWESRGAVVRGSFDPALADAQFCDRSLLARIHRYTIAELRRGIEPVSARACYRFLVRWQHLHPETRLAGEAGTREAIAQLSGFEAAAGAWESQLLTARIAGYRPELLDRLCLCGEVAWGRLAPAALEARSRPSRATPIALFPRDDLDALLESARPSVPREADAAPLGGPAQRVLELLDQRGALFASEIQKRSRLLAVQVEEALRELVARGRITCDGFAPLRRLLTGARPRARPRPGRLRITPNGVTRPGVARGSGASAGMEGRWRRWPAPPISPSSAPRPATSTGRRSRREWPSGCFAATAWCSGICSRASGCRKAGVPSTAHCARWKRAARCAGGAS
ncbi:MAG: ATP-dependent DNA helicase, partial [Myxococcota bacterium]